MDFKTGDVVQLNSGGPALTVVEKNADENTVAVCWIDEKGGIWRYDFPPECLKEYAHEAA